MNGVLLLFVIMAAIGVTAFAHQRGVQAGLVIVSIAAAVSFIPGVPHFEFESEVILGAVMPPLLYSATRNFPLSQFIINIRPILGLGVGLVIVTTVTIGFAANWLIPSLGLSAAFVLAAIVSPPDTVTTVTHGHELGLTRRVISILTGESIVNDAAALTLFTVATVAVTKSDSFIGNPLLLFLYGAFVGILIGLAIGKVASLLRAQLHNATMETVVGLLIPFTAFLAAEEVHASGVLAVIAAGFTVSVSTYFPNAGQGLSYVTRLQESAVWSVVDLLLESLVFAYIGLQARFILDDLRASTYSTRDVLIAAIIVLLLVMLIRIGWIYLLYAHWAAQQQRIQQQLGKTPWSRWLLRRLIRTRRARGHPPEFRRRRRLEIPTGAEKFLIGWTGMRGIVTLGAAAAVPMTTHAGAPFEGREVIQFVAFFVAIGTLLIQGASLPMLTRRFALDTSADVQVQAQRLTRALETAVSRQVSTDDQLDQAARSHEFFEQQREALVEAVFNGTIDDESAKAVIYTLDLEEAALTSRAETRQNAGVDIAPPPSSD